MNRTIIKLTAASLLCLLSITVSAQNDTRAPGLYAIVGGESIPLVYSNGTSSNSGTGFFGAIEVSRQQYIYKGASSGIVADSTFVMVCDMGKKTVTRTLRKYDIFISTVTPNNMVAVPLEVKKNKRIYSEGTAINGINTKMRTSLGISWEQITDNSYLITVHGLVPGEYGFVFKTARFDNYDFTAMFGFTVPEPVGTEQPTVEQ